MSESKFLFKWKENGKPKETVVEAGNYPEACFLLAIHHAELYRLGWPRDFELDLTKAERVEG